MSLTRFETRWYVAVDEQEAQRLARGDASARVEVTGGLELLHAQNGWALWSDGKLTTSTGLPDALRSTRSLAPAAVELISRLWEAGSEPRIEGGWRTLARVVELVSEEVVAEGPAEAPFSPPSERRLVVRMADGGERVWWVRASNSPDGVTFKLYDQRQASTDMWRSRQAAN